MGSGGLSDRLSGTPLITVITVVNAWYDQHVVIKLIKTASLTRKTAPWHGSVTIRESSPVS